MEGGINSNSINILFIFFFLCVQTQNDDVAPVNIGPADRKRTLSFQSTCVTMLVWQSLGGAINSNSFNILIIFFFLCVDSK